VKIGLVQTNPIIGDFEVNCRNIVTKAHQAIEQGCRLVIFPEMAVTGYPPQDLLERASFLNDNERAVAGLLRDLPAIDVMFGCIERRHDHHGKPLYNSVVVARNGELIFKARKRLLPSYDVFDETRYFEPGPPSGLYNLDELTFGVTVCEDIWFHEVGEYQVDPVNDLFTTAADLKTRIDILVNVSASPFQRGKEATRYSIFRSICSRFHVPFFYINQVGGQDSLLFDGRSVAMDAGGRVIGKGASFAEDLFCIDTSTWQGEFHCQVDEDEVAAVHDGLVMGVRDYVRKCGFSSAVLGLSGGIDSALTATLAVRALGAGNVTGVALPSPYSSSDSLEDARILAKNLGCRFEIIPINDLFATYRKSLQPLFAGMPEDLTEQNIQARIRGNLLMALSNKFKSLLLTTGNKSEMAVGYCTLYGDMSGGLAVISDVPKQLVYELSRFVNRDGEVIPTRSITKAPTAELKPDQYDQDDLPPYDMLDQILELHLEKGFGLAAIISQGFDEKIVRDILRRIRINEYKRKQAPMGLKVTSKAFGYGRRYPNVQNYIE
jgi:NAD+ synthase (glutamine-hydrolysing)